MVFLVFYDTLFIIIPNFLSLFAGFVDRAHLKLSNEHILLIEHVYFATCLQFIFSCLKVKIPFSTLQVNILLFQ